MRFEHAALIRHAGRAGQTDNPTRSSQGRSAAPTRDEAVASLHRHRPGAGVDQGDGAPVRPALPQAPPAVYMETGGQRAMHGWCRSSLGGRHAGPAGTSDCGSCASWPLHQVRHMFTARSANCPSASRATLRELPTWRALRQRRQHWRRPEAPRAPRRRRAGKVPYRPATRVYETEGSYWSCEPCTEGASVRQTECGVRWVGDRWRCVKRRRWQRAILKVPVACAAR